MIKKIKEKLKNDELLKGSVILFFTMNLYNFLNYFYHFLMARLLGKVDYGTLAVLFSFIYIFSIPSEAIQNIITSYVSKLNLNKEKGKIKYLFVKSISKGLFFSLIAFLIFAIAAYFISNFLDIKFLLLVFTGILIFFSILMPMIRGVLQGEKKFSKLGYSMIIEGVFKVILGISIFYLGWKVYGAIFAVIISVIISFIVGLLFIKDILKNEKKETKFEGIYNYSIPYFISIFVIVLMYSLDIVFAKRFFSPEEVGIYAVASMIGKMIFFGTFAISKSMLPLASEKHESGEKTSFLLKKSLKIVSLISIIALIIYLFFPKLIIRILFGSQYLEASNILFFIGLALTLLSFSNVILLYKLSTNKIKKPYILLIFVFIEIIGFIVFHSSLLEFSISFLISNAIFFIFLLILNKRQF
jgi:O-antigen/teichoic acid export membrane protein